MSKCHTCDGSGTLIAMRSWFTADGYRRYRCGICGGTGQSSYRSGDYEAGQRRLRKLFNIVPTLPNSRSNEQMEPPNGR